MGQIRLDRGVTAVRETGAISAIFHPTVGWTFLKMAANMEYSSS